MNGTDLLNEFRKSRSETAFAELVRRYTNLVYSVSKRRVGNGSLAEDVTQLVFIRLAKVAPALPGEAELAGWLHRTAVHASIDLWRTELRRRVREEHAAAMHTEPSPEVVWTDLSPVLDEALNELNEADRQVLLLRFFGEKSMKEVGLSLGVSEDAAKMRVSRAMERLRERLGTHGVICSTLLLGTFLQERAIEAAPASLGATLAAVRIPRGAGAGLRGLLVALLQGPRLKTATILSLAIAVGVTVVHFLSSWNSSAPDPSGSAVEAGTAQFAGPRSQALMMADSKPGAEQAEQPPDPVKLLEGVAQARNRFYSGSMDIQLTVDNFTGPRRETNEYLLKVLFEGRKLRFEQFEDSYSYVNREPNEEGEFAKTQIDKGKLSRAEAVKAGLLQMRKAHYTSIWNGDSYLKFDDQGQGSATIASNTHNSSLSIFDPRCLGLRHPLFSSSTVESCLAYEGAKSVQLLGKETVAKLPTWHVQVRSKYDEVLDYWVDVARPQRVLKHAKGKDVVLSRYGDGTAIPTEIESMEYPTTRMTVSNAQWNISVEPFTWTLAGLDMKTNSSVSDIRSQRMLGYWTGNGLVSVPVKPQPGDIFAPSLAERMATLTDMPRTEAGFEAANWVMLNTPDGPAVEKAAQVILKEHVQSPQLARLCKEMDRMRPRCATNLLEQILKRNPYAGVRAAACFTLATLYKDQADYGTNSIATATAERLFERVISDFSSVGREGPNMAANAERELYEIRNVFVGKPAPETIGEDLDGQPIDLSEYRGKVVVLVFWSNSFFSESKVLGKLKAQMEGKPFALIGVNVDWDANKTREAVQKYQIDWPSFKEHRDGPIYRAWNIHSWPSVIVLDAKGTIRYRGLRGPALRRAVESLLKEISG